MFEPCPITQILFSDYPVKLSLVRVDKRGSVVITAHDFLRLVEIVSLYNGYRHIYIQIQPRNIINKVVFDIDAGNLRDAYEDMRRLVEVFEEEKVPYVVAYSGRRGFHVYLITKRVEITETSTLALTLKSVISYYASRAELKHLDAETGYKIGGWIRLPGTIHPVTKHYAVLLSYEDVERGLSHIVELSKRPYCPRIEVRRMPPDPRDYVFRVPLPEYPVMGTPQDAISARIPQNIVKYLKEMIRPCVLQSVLVDNPTHFARTQFVTELCWLWFTEEDIVEIIEKLRWDDYDRRITLYHVKKICEKVRDGVLYPASCRSLQNRLMCLGQSCPYYPAYNYWWRL